MDYDSNVKLRLTLQEYFRKYQPPLLATRVRTIRSSFLLGAEAHRRDISSAKVVFYDTGHFALETHVEEISDQIRSFLTRLIQSGKF